MEVEGARAGPEEPVLEKPVGGQGLRVMDKLKELKKKQIVLKPKIIEFLKKKLNPFTRNTRLN